MNRVIQDTDIDALSAKLACLEYKYLPTGTEHAFKNHDLIPYNNYTQYHQMYWQTLMSLNKNNNRRLIGKLKQNIKHSSPVINYGTYLRTVAIDLNITRYLNQLDNTVQNIDITNGYKGMIQIVNLGCGSDLRFIQFLQNNHERISKYIDLDFQDSIDLKSKILNKLLPKLNFGFNWDDKYVAKPCDLNDKNNLFELLEQYTDKETPTIVITECVLCYMSKENSQIIIDSIKGFYKTGIWISYDPIGGDDPNDKFGTIMKQNLLNSRNLNLPTLLEFNSKLSYSNRWVSYEEVTIHNLYEFLSENIAQSELKRLQKCQFLDELEELKIMQSHYIILKAQW